MLKVWQLILLIIILVGISSFFLKYKMVSLIEKESKLGIDKTPPGPAQFSETPQLQTSNNSTELIGFAESNSTLVILDNDKAIKEVKINENARFKTRIPLEQGDNDISLQVIDSSGNQNEQASRLKIVRN